MFSKTSHKKFLKNKTSLFLLITIVIIGGAYVYTTYVDNTEASIHGTAGLPPHTHLNWTSSATGDKIWSTGNSSSPPTCDGSTGSDCVRHIQADLNFLNTYNNWNFYNDGATIAVDGDYDSSTADMVTAFQAATNIAIDGVVGNQTLAQMESSIFGEQRTFRLRAGAEQRFLMHGKCRWYKNGTGTHIFVPIKTSAEYTSWHNNAPSGISKAEDSGSSGPADCNITGSQSGGTGTGTSGSGGTGDTIPPPSNYWCVCVWGGGAGACNAHCSTSNKNGSGCSCFGYGGIFDCSSSSCAF
ncbi:MAG: peptidoglycan-binding domain-containing protein [Candidatus Spechtbacterales bacterium]|nr:peptidoglycan-binding domain-containing protein [Candidatus Spechtbacterales bacterium]